MKAHTHVLKLKEQAFLACGTVSQLTYPSTGLDMMRESLLLLACLM